MKKLTRIVKLALIILFGTAVLVAFIPFMEMLPQIPFKIFSDIDEVKAYDKYTADYPVENNDSHVLPDMIITDCTIRKLEYNGQKYMLYAYAFESTEMAQNYYQSYGLDITKTLPGIFILSRE